MPQLSEDDPRFWENIKGKGEVCVDPFEFQAAISEMKVTEDDANLDMQELADMVLKIASEKDYGAIPSDRFTKYELGGFALKVLNRLKELGNSPRPQRILPDATGSAHPVRAA